MQESQPKPTINIIGAGKLGKTIVKLIVVHQAGRIQGVCNSSLESSIQAAKFIGEGAPCQRIDELSPADITFITVPDDQIQRACDQLAKSKQLNTAGIVVHCSGLLSSDVLNSVKLKGCQVVSVHPMRSFADPKISVAQFAGTYCAVEGSKMAEPTIAELFTKLGGKVIPIDKHKKGNYHAGGVIASNYLVTLANSAITNLESAGIQREEATDIILNLMQGTLTNLSRTKSTKESLTGPIKRGDIETIKKHMAVMPNDGFKRLYAALGELTLEITTHDKEKKQAIKNVLAEHPDPWEPSFSFLKAKL